MFPSVIVRFIIVAVTAFVAVAETGVDLSVATTPEQWACLVSEHNVSYSIIRTFRNKGAVDENAGTSMVNAFNAGVKELGAYMFPCVPTSSYAIANNISCEAPAMQVVRTMQYFCKNGIKVQRTSQQSVPEGLSVNRIWIDIEDETPSKYYDADPIVNQAFIAEMVFVLEKLHVPVGIYSTKTYWENIMGNVLGYSKYPLWYPRYDGVDSLDFFTPFADFTSVQIKQTAGDSGWCGITQVDNDYRL